MKKIILAIFLLVFLMACGSRKESTSIQEEAPTDSLITEGADTTAAVGETEEEEETPPRAVDELFDDFIYAFMEKQQFQKARIKFPLQYIIGGKDSLIQKKDWTFNRLYADLDIYTMIFYNANEAGIEKDTSVNQVIVDCIDLTNETIKQYTFKRNNTLWQLALLKEHNIEMSVDSNFYHFYKEFVTDSLFQRKHIAESIEFETYDEDMGEDIEGTLDIEQWYEFKPSLPSDMITNITYGKKPSDSSERVLVLSSLSGGMNCKLYFLREAEHWKLVRFEN